MRLDFGMPALADDRLDAGSLERVLVDRERLAVTHLVLRAPFASEEILVPLDLVVGTAEGRLRLRPGRDELYVLPRYYEGRTSDVPAGRVDTSLVPEPPEQRQPLEEALALSGDTVELGPETRVMTADGEEAQLTGVAASDPAGGVSFLWARGPGGGEARIPAAWIGVLREDVIALTATRDDVLRLHPPPRPPAHADLEGLSGMGGLGGETREQAFGPDFVDELAPKEDIAAHSPPTRRPGEIGGRRADEREPQAPGGTKRRAIG